ncbi:MAG: hypothetical protein IIB94_14010 [Candidatus Marinimicrobia bacterium]|nr:hypothetical protein [Candidatus Neomarinimicrobiota bacterium]
MGQSIYDSRIYNSPFLCITVLEEILEAFFYVIRDSSSQAVLPGKNLRSTTILRKQYHYREKRVTRKRGGALCIAPRLF